MTKTFFSTKGPVRRGCGHTHLTISAARRCQEKDQRSCKAVGGYSDRIIIAVEDGEERPLTEEESVRS